MVEPNQELVKKGKDVNLIGLRQQWPVSHELATSAAFADTLDEWGWSPENSESLRVAGVGLGTVRSATLEIRGDAKVKTKTEAQKRQVAKKLIRRVRNALPSVLAKLKPEEVEVTRQQFLSGNLYDSTSLIVAYLDKIDGPLQRLDEHFMRYNRKQSLHAEVAAARRDLSQTDAKQEVARGALPADTLAFYEAKGRVMELILELNRIARNAFDGQAHLIGQFNKDLLNNATRSRAMPTAEEVEEPETSSPVAV